MKPRHIAIIMDGNGRWAQARGLPRGDGHRAGSEVSRAVIEECVRLELEVLTLYCLSSENWKRPPDELLSLMTLLCWYLAAERPRLIERNIRLRVIGQQETLPSDVRDEISQSLAATSQNTGMTLCLAINYGSRAEIVTAIKSIVRDVISQQISPDNINEACIASRLDTAGIPDPDLLIRTGGEMRLSNYLLWQLSYAELWCTPVYWPDFSVAMLHEAIDNFAHRERRFGGLGR